MRDATLFCSLKKLGFSLERRNHAARNGIRRTAVRGDLPRDAVLRRAHIRLVNVVQRNS